MRPAKEMTFLEEQAYIAQAAPLHYRVGEVVYRWSVEEGKWTEVDFSSELIQSLKEARVLPPTKGLN